jgi:hypothetical protein
MRKELIFAIFAGILFGVVIAFGIFRANKAIKTNPPELSTSKQSGSDVIDKKDSKSSITIAKPENGDVLGNDVTTISGISMPNAKMLISSNLEDHFLTSNENGAFEQEIELAPSINQIDIIVIDENSTVATENIVIVYSNEYFKQISIDEENGSEATSEAEIISEKVEKKLDLAKNKPKAFIGTITDITEDTIQMKNEGDEIKQISIAESTNYVEIKDKTKDLTFEDIAIGDFIVAMGFQNGSGVLEARRIIITNPPDEDDKKIFFGKLSEVVNKTATFESEQAEETTFTFGRRWNGPEIDELVEGENYVVVAILDDDDYVIRTIESIVQEVDAEPSPSPIEEN